MRFCKLIAIIAILLAFCGVTFAQTATYVPSQIADIQGLAAALGGGYYDAKFQYGAKADGQQFADAVMTSGSANLQSTLATFTTADVGKLIGVKGAGASGGTLITTISAFVDAHNVTLAVSAGTTVSAKLFCYGSDDTTAIQNAVNAASASAAGGGTVFLRPGIYCTSTGIVWKTKVSLVGAGVGASILKPIHSLSHPTNSAVITGTISAGVFSSSLPCTLSNFVKFEIDGTFMGAATFSVGQKGIYIQAMALCTFQDLYIHDTGATGLGVDYLADSVIYNVTAYNCGRLGTTASAGSSGIGIGTGATMTVPYNGTTAAISDNVTIFGCNAYGNKRYGIFVESQGSGSRGCTIAQCKSEQNGYGGIGVAGSDRLNKVLGCNVTNNAGYGIYVGADTIAFLDAPTSYIIANNTVHSNTYVNVFVDASHVANYASVRTFAANQRGQIINNNITNTFTTSQPNGIGLMVAASPVFGLQNLEISGNNIHDVKCHGMVVTGGCITALTPAATSATTLNIVPISTALASGTVLTFASGATATLSSAYVANGPSLAVSSLAGPIAAGDYVKSFRVTTTAAASATSISITPQNMWLASGTVLTFASGATATLSANYTNAATTLSVNALAASISAGDYIVTTIDHLTIKNNRVYGNGLGTSATYDAFHLSGATLTNFVMSGNEGYDGAWGIDGSVLSHTPTQRYGLYINAFIASGIVDDTNRFHDSLTGQVNFAVLPAYGPLAKRSLRSFGAKGDGVYLAGAASLTGTALTVTGGTLTSADVGKIVSVGAAGANSGPLVTTIATVTGPTTGTTTATATTNVTSKDIAYGTNDTAVFASCLAVGPGDISVADGSYCVQPATTTNPAIDITKSGTTLTGSGMGKSKIWRMGWESTIVRVSPNGANTDNVRISDLTVSCAIPMTIRDNTNFLCYGIQLDDATTSNSPTYVVRDSTVERCEVSGVAFGIAIMNGSQRCKILNAVAHDTVADGHGVYDYFYPCSDTLIQGCTVYNSGDDAYACNSWLENGSTLPNKNTTFSNCIATNSGSRGFALLGPDGVTVTGCRVETTYLAGILLQAGGPTAGRFMAAKSAVIVGNQVIGAGKGVRGLGNTGTAVSGQTGGIVLNCAGNGFNIDDVQILGNQILPSRSTSNSAGSGIAAFTQAGAGVLSNLLIDSNRIKGAFVLPDATNQIVTGNAGTAAIYVNNASGVNVRSNQITSSYATGVTLGSSCSGVQSIGGNTFDTLNTSATATTYAVDIAGGAPITVTSNSAVNNTNLTGGVKLSAPWLTNYAARLEGNSWGALTGTTYAESVVNTSLFSGFTNANIAGQSGTGTLSLTWAAPTSGGSGSMVNASGVVTGSAAAGAMVNIALLPVGRRDVHIAATINAITAGSAGNIFLVLCSDGANNFYRVDCLTGAISSVVSGQAAATVQTALFSGGTQAADIIHAIVRGERLEVYRERSGTWTLMTAFNSLSPSLGGTFSGIQGGTTTPANGSFSKVEIR